MTASRDPADRVDAERVDVVGTPISAVSYQVILEAMHQSPRDRAQVFAFCNVHSVMTARRDPAVRDALVAADVATPDGMPLVWMLRRQGLSNQPRVYGPDLMAYALPYGIDRGWKHFFFGANDTTLDQLCAAAEELAPGVQIVGRHAPPYRPMTDSEEDAVIMAIRSSGADIVWVGLGMPKQELWMHRIHGRLPGVSLMGVGAAFDLLSGTVPQAPDWIQDRGLEWAYRLRREPRRLWRRYLVNNPAFVLQAAKQLMRQRLRTRRR